MFKDKNTLLGFLLIFGILIAYSIYTAPSKEDMVKKSQREDSLRIAQQAIQSQEELKINDANQVVAENPVSTAIEDTTKKSDFLGLPFQQPENIEESVYFVENDLIKLGLSSKGGKIKSLQLKDFLKFDKTPLMLFNENFHTFGVNFFANNYLVTSNNLTFEPVFYNFQADEKSAIIDENSKDTLKFGMRLYPSYSDSLEQNSWLEFQYLLAPNSYLIDFNIEFHNLRNYLPTNTNFIDFYANAEVRQQEKSLENERNVTTVFYRFFEDDVDYLSERKDDIESLKTRVQWVSFKQQFFSFTMIAPNGFQSGEVQVSTNEAHSDTTYLRSMSATMSIPIPMDGSQSFVIPLKLYSGPNHYRTLKDLNLELERQIPLGWSFFLMQWINRYAVIPVFNYLEGFNLNYGIIILILTILLKIVLFPLAYKSYLSSARMKVLKPEIDEIGKKYPKKDEAMKKQQATMELYKKAGVNPMAGCLPMLLQFPILIALFRFFLLQ
jgi:YidC/Oxa1 family membrane protein insertase